MVYFRPLHQKPFLTEEDVSERLAFAKKFETTPVAWWSAPIHMVIDVKHSSHGTCRKKGRGLHVGHATSVVKTKFNPGGAALVRGLATDSCLRGPANATKCKKTRRYASFCACECHAPRS